MRGFVVLEKFEIGKRNILIWNPLKTFTDRAEAERFRDEVQARLPKSELRIHEVSLDAVPVPGEDAIR